MKFILIILAVTSNGQNVEVQRFPELPMTLEVCKATAEYTLRYILERAPELRDVTKIQCRAEISL